MIRVARLTVSLLFILLALGCAVAAIETPEVQRADQAEQNAKLKLFEKTAQYAQSYYERTGQYPTEGKIGSSLGFTGSIPPNIGVDGHQEDGAWRVGCRQEEDFRPLSTDSFVLSAWNGNWFDCFASPSGTNNLRTIQRGWISEVIYFSACGLLFAFSAWAVWPFRKSVKQFG